MNNDEHEAFVHRFVPVEESGRKSYQGDRPYGSRSRDQTPGASSTWHRGGGYDNNPHDESRRRRVVGDNTWNSNSSSSWKNYGSWDDAGNHGWLQDKKSGWWSSEPARCRANVAREAPRARSDKAASRENRRTRTPTARPSRNVRRNSVRRSPSGKYRRRSSAQKVYASDRSSSRKRRRRSNRFD